MSRRISPATLLLAIVAVLFGLLGAYTVRQQYRQQPLAAPEQVTAQPSMIVPMASTALQSGRKITLGDIALFSLTSDQMKKQGINEIFMSSPQQIIGRVLRDDMLKGKTFDATMFYPEGTGPTVADQLEPGKRAVTVPVEVDAAVAGFATPGAWVDVLFRSEANQSKEHPETTITLIERVKVLALNQDTFEGARSQDNSRRNSDMSSVTLAVGPEQAAALQVVDARGTLSLALRHPEDMTTFLGTSPRTMDELLQIPPADRHRMEIYRGNRLSEVEFRDDDRLTPSDPAVARTQQARRTDTQPAN